MKGGRDARRVIVTSTPLLSKVLLIVIEVPATSKGPRRLRAEYTENPTTAALPYIQYYDTDVPTD